MESIEQCVGKNVARDPVKSRIIVKGGDAISSILNLTNHLAMNGEDKYSRKFANYAADAIREFERSIEHLL